MQGIILRRPVKLYLFISNRALYYNSAEIHQELEDEEGNKWRLNQAKPKIKTF